MAVGELNQHFWNWLGVLHQWNRPIGPVDQRGLRMDAEKVISGGENFLGRHGPVRDSAGNLVRFSQNLAPTNSAAGQENAVTLRPVIAPAAFYILQFRRAA